MDMVSLTAEQMMNLSTIKDLDDTDLAGIAAHKCAQTLAYYWESQLPENDAKFVIGDAEDAMASLLKWANQVKEVHDKLREGLEP